MTTVTSLALPLTTRPFDGECALSFSARLAEANGVQLHGLLADIGGHSPDRFGPEQWSRLANRSNLSFEGIEDLVTLPTGGEPAFKFLGARLKRNQIVPMRWMRICPICVAERGMLRAVWRLPPWTACAEHGVALVDTCDCGKHLTVGRATKVAAHPFTCACGKPFEDIATRPASDSTIAMSRWLGHLVGPRLSAAPLDRWLDAEGRLGEPFSPFDERNPISLLDALVVIEVLGIAAGTPAFEDEPIDPVSAWRNGGSLQSATLDQWVPKVEAAMEVIAGWPESWHRVLEEVAGRNPHAGDKEPRHLLATRIGQMVLRPYKGKDGRPCRLVAQETENWLRGRGYVVRRKTPIHDSETARIMHWSMNQRILKKRLGITKGRDETLLRIYREVLNYFDRNNERSSDPAVLGEDVFAAVCQRLERADEYRYRPTENLMAPYAVAAYLSNPTTEGNAEGWLHPELLTPIEDPRRVSFKAMGTLFARADVEAMRRRLAEASTLVTEIPEGYIPYSLAGKFLCSTFFGRTDVILSITRGAIPVVSKVAEPRLSELFLDLSVGRRIVRDVYFQTLVEDDTFGGNYRCQIVVDEHWPGRGIVLTPEENKTLVDQKILRVNVRYRKTGKRIKPYNHYAIVDHLLRLYRSHGPTGLPHLDGALAEMNAEKSVAA